MLSFTLVIATKGRTEELSMLFTSLALQEYPPLECIIVDQNPDERLDEIIGHWSSRLNVRRLRALPGVSRARNLGLLQARGDIVAFPDDDCWYTPSLLQSVATWFQNHSDFDILTVAAQDLDGKPSGNRWVQPRCEIHPLNAFRTTFCSSIFLRRRSLDGPACFDETIGPGAGTPWSCGEETDYILHLLRLGARGFFESGLRVGHPKRDMLSGQVDRIRAFGYGSGMGYVLRKHGLLLLGTAFIAFDLLRCMLAAIKSDRLGSSLCLHHARGIASAWLDSSRRVSQ